MEQNIKTGTKNLYMLFDKKSDTYILEPIPAVSFTDVLRMLILSYKNNPNQLYFQFPEDFELHCVGRLGLDFGVDTHTDDGEQINDKYSFVDILVHCKTFQPVENNEQT